MILTDTSIIGDDPSVPAQLWLAQQILGQLRESVIITDAEIEEPGPHFVWVNAAFTKMTGYTAEEVQGRNPRILQGPKTRRSTLDRLRRQLTRGESFTGDDINYRKDGTEFYIDWYIEPLCDQAGRITHFVAVQRDTTEARQLEKQLLQAQRLESIGMLASGIAHDLNNILGPVLMGAEILHSRISDPGDAQMLEMMKKAAERGSSLVRQILSFARGLGSLQLETQLRHLVADIVTLASRTFPDRIRVRQELPGDLWPVAADATQMHQVFMNLCVNARDAIEGAGSVTFTGENLTLPAPYAVRDTMLPAGNYVRLGVTDTGSGIPAEIIDKIFDAFFTTKAPGQGTGLGLSTTLSIIKNHGGVLDLTSTPGHGTRFDVYLPAAEQKLPSAPAAPPAPRRGSGQPVLVIDDKIALLEITRELLTSIGYRVLTAATGGAGVELFDRERPAVVILALHLHDPAHTGTLRQIRALDPNARIIIVSSSGDQETAALTPAPHAVLSKPVTIENLQRTLSEVLA